MAKNMIQFQKGVSLPDFIARYGTEEQPGRALSATLAEWIHLSQIWAD